MSHFEHFCRPLSVAASIAIAFCSQAVSAQSLDDYHGAFVGEAAVVDPQAGTEAVRDIDIVIGKPDRGDLRIDWVNVDRVDGRRDVPGVKRRAGSLVFDQVDGGDYLVENRGYDPFHERDELAPIEGDPLRWGYLGDDGLRIFSFVILDDGSYELQTYVRRLDGDRLELDFVRIVDGEVQRRITGRAQRAK
ncbi:MAG: hypothetical protein R3C97_04045 [Geminicoccaceae bacterium]